MNTQIKIMYRDTLSAGGASEPIKNCEVRKWPAVSGA